MKIRRGVTRCLAPRSQRFLEKLHTSKNTQTKRRPLPSRYLVIYQFEPIYSRCLSA